MQQPGGWRAEHGRRCMPCNALLASAQPASIALPCRADAWVRYAVWCGILAAFYLLYSLPASYLRHYAADWQNKEELK